MGLWLHLHLRPVTVVDRGTRLPDGFITDSPVIVAARLVWDNRSTTCVISASICSRAWTLPRVDAACKEEVKALWPDGFSGAAVQLFPTEEGEPGMTVTITPGPGEPSLRDPIT